MEEHRVVEIPQLKEAGDTENGRNLRDLPPTYIPMRNGIFYSLAASFAEEVGADYIIGGHNREDVEVFPDTTPAFFESFQKAIWAGSKLLGERRTTILRPLQLKSKPEVVSLAAGLGVPLSSCSALLLGYIGRPTGLYWVTNTVFENVFGSRRVGRAAGHSVEPAKRGRKH